MYFMISGLLLFSLCYNLQLNCKSGQTPMSCMRNLVVPRYSISQASVILRRSCIRCQAVQFSTTSSLLKKTGDRNKNRGVSALRGTGPRYPRALSKEPLPQPVLDPARRSKIQVNEKHGLWGFFDKDKKAFEKPEVVAAHGGMTPAAFL